MRRRYRKLRRRKHKSLMRNTIIVMVVLTLGFATGYSAFSTNISLNAKGNIKQKSFTISKLKENVVSSGDGLYLDSTEVNRYIYRGGDVENFIRIDNELYRIISIEANNDLKILRNEVLSGVFFDPLSNQVNRTAYNVYNDANDDYCGHAYYQNSYTGCNMWGSYTTMKDSYGNSITEMAFDIGGSWTDVKFANKNYRLPNSEAYANTYLNTVYYNNFSSKTQNKIISHDYYVGVLDSANHSIETDISQERKNIWTGKIGLINATDYVKASTNPNCSGVRKYSYKAWGTGGIEECYGTRGQQNWMYSSVSVSTLNPISRPWSGYVWSTYSDGSLYRMGGQEQGGGIRPVLFLSSDVKLKGFGTQNNPYYIANE